jgi:hypothetical protein
MPRMGYAESVWDEYGRRGRLSAFPGVYAAVQLIRRCLATFDLVCAEVAIARMVFAVRRDFDAAARSPNF